TLWDERVDMDIASAVASSPIRGESHPVDPTQFRLPMYACASAFRITGKEDLATARAVSIAIGALGIALSAGFAWELFGAEVAVLAAWLLALSPYYLAYGRIAMTEGDIFVATTVTAACWAFVRFLRRPNRVRWLVAAMALGLAIAAKAFSLI